MCVCVKTYADVIRGHKCSEMASARHQDLRDVRQQKSMGEETRGPPGQMSGPGELVCACVCACVARVAMLTALLQNVVLFIAINQKFSHDLHACLF